MIKILYIANNQQPDFLSDSIFLGLKELDGVEVFEYNYLWYLYDSTQKESLVNRVHGRGFTYYGELPQREHLPVIEEIFQPLMDGFYDKVIYGNVHRNLDHLEVVTSNMKKEDIIFLDGNDDKAIKPELLNKGVYFKREIDSKMYAEYGDKLNPIQFSIPEKKIVTSAIDKDKLIGYVIPGIMETFIFDKEEDYYNDYKRSYFAYTWKKSGWDCLRHYEILAAGCVPLFLDIAFIPQHTMKNYPVKILIDFYIQSGIYDLFYMGEKPEYDDRNTLITNKDLDASISIDLSKENGKLYSDTLQKLRNYTLENLTCKAEAKRVLETSNKKKG